MTAILHTTQLKRELSADNWFMLGVAARESKDEDKVFACFEQAIKLWRVEKATTGQISNLAEEFVALMKLLGQSTLQGRVRKLIGKSKEQENTEVFKAKQCLKQGDLPLALHHSFCAVQELYSKFQENKYSFTVLGEFFSSLQMCGDIYEVRGCAQEAKFLYSVGIEISKIAQLPLVTSRLSRSLSIVEIHSGEFLSAQSLIPKEDKKLMGDLLMSVWEARTLSRIGHTQALLVHQDLSNDELLQTAKKCYKAAKATHELIFIKYCEGSVAEAQKAWGRLGKPTARDLLRQGICTKNTATLKNALSICLKSGENIPLIKDICHALMSLGSNPAKYHAISVGLTSSFLLQTKTFANTDSLFTFPITLPEHWVMIVASICDDSALRITRFEGSKEPKSVVLAGRQDVILLEEFNSIIDISDKILNRKITLSEEKKTWWEERFALDTKLKDLLSRIENEWLGDIKALLTPHEQNKENPVILVLGNELQPLPWESLPALRSCQVTRMPSVSLVEKHLQKQQKLSTKRGFYILNPLNDPKEKTIFEERFSKKYEWDGINAKTPNHEEFLKALHDYDIFIYCGHNNGTQYLPKHLMEQHVKKIKSIAFLMGCSSVEKIKLGKYDSAGIVDNYMVSFCPALVGTLWDITNRDIDLFLENALVLIKDEDNPQNLLTAVSQSRDVCQLKYLNGAATVVYGLPC